MPPTSGHLGLVAVLVGHNTASEVYVRNKVKTAQDLGICSEKITPPDSISTEELLALVDQLNAREEVDGILVQLPLPKQVDTKRILLAVSPEKDVDGFHPFNVGCLVAALPAPRACTPAGIIQLLKRSGIPIAGKRAVVVGRSDIVGKPVALLLLHEHATVTICHSKTADLPAVCREADILVAAMGRAALIDANCIKPGATVIDVGMNSLTSRDDVARISGIPRRSSPLLTQKEVCWWETWTRLLWWKSPGLTLPCPEGSGRSPLPCSWPTPWNPPSAAWEYVKSWAYGRSGVRKELRGRSAGWLGMSFDRGR